MPLVKIIVRRVLLGVLTLLLVSVLVFAATQTLPGDTAQAILGKSATPATLKALRQELGLDRPAVVQYGSWLSGIVRGNLGESLAAKAPVTSVISTRVRNSAVLVLLAAIISIPLSILIGSLSGLLRDHVFDSATSLGSLALAALPEFVIGILLLVLFATQVFHWFPACRGGPAERAVHEPAEHPHPAGPHPRAGCLALHRAHPARLDGRGARERLRADGAAQGHARAHRSAPPRSAQRRHSGASRSSP